MLTMITVTAGFSIGTFIVLIAIFFAFRSRSFGKDSVFFLAIGFVMIGLATWQLIKPEPDVGYIPYDAPVEQPD